MIHATASEGLLARLLNLLRPSGMVVPVPVRVRRAAALALVPLALAPAAVAQRGGTTGGGSDRGGSHRDSAATVRRAPAVPPSARRPAPARSGYDETQRRIEEQRRAADERQREAERRIEQQRQAVEERQRETQRRIEQQRREMEERQREAERRAGGQRGSGDRSGYGQSGYDRSGYGSGYDRYWGSSWSPVLRYRQRVRVESDRHYGYGSSVLDIRTSYRQRVSGGYSSGDRVEVRIERIEVYQDGRYLGYVDYYDLPRDFDHVTATRMRNGELRLDDDLLLVGEASVGFELIRFDGNDFYGSWRRQYDALSLDLRRSSTRRVGYSRLFDPYAYRGYVPVSIVPDLQDDFYGYNGGYYGQSGSGYDQPGYSRDGYEGPVQGRSPRGCTDGSGTVNTPSSRPQGGSVEGRSAPARSPRNRTVTLPGGQTVQVERETSVEAAEGGN